MTNVIVRCREVSSVLRYHLLGLLSCCIWDEYICLLFVGVRCIEVSVNGGSTALKTANGFINLRVVNNIRS